MLTYIISHHNLKNTLYNLIGRFSALTDDLLTVNLDKSETNLSTKYRVLSNT